MISSTGYLTKKNKSVIYISLGSQLFLSKEMVQEIINGINDTNYSVVWSMRNLNKNLHFNIDNGKYFISSWIPQATLLQHQSISMAIMHGGSNGIHESLYFGIPIIVIPFLGDQFDWAVRVSDAGVGVQLLLHQWTSSYLKQSVNVVTESLVATATNLESVRNKIKSLLRMKEHTLKYSQSITS